MVPAQKRLILWVGSKHSGKTTSVTRLIQMVRCEGFIVAGILEPSLYDNGELIGFDVLDIQNEKRTPLARLKQDKSKVGRFNFISNGLEFGNEVLNLEAVKSADLVVIDEFGPLELEGKGWRRNIDSLLSSDDAIILIVIRRELKEALQKIYTNFPCLELEALEEKSAREVIALLRKRRQSL